MPCFHAIPVLCNLGSARAVRRDASVSSRLRSARISAPMPSAARQRLLGRTPRRIYQSITLKSEFLLSVFPVPFLHGLDGDDGKRQELHASQSFWVPGSGWRFEGSKPASPPSARRSPRWSSAVVCGDLEAMVKGEGTKCLDVVLGDMSAGRVVGPLAGPEGKVPDPERGEIASKARHLCRSSASSRRRSSMRVPAFSAWKKRSNLQRSSYQRSTVQAVSSRPGPRCQQHPVQR